ncbi:TIGR01212 family radical SAM protein [Peptoniphilus indolicus]|uniref:TIGR01212 family radical SAM protein n=2 Tax=Peptoniphilus indolicus TaxID=33030 RepID=G4D601_9FIRM|nr:TIGR01212 family radical SAM protein [Peptoniphilus indolicus]EGY77482.1 TIGR01212 family radical SAM protein [Peptoniphilus indolicus ATCC 29427]SUB76212.1 (Dimethylallyl)adenosine tRNA methylthiotransferase MiaB [Peptoniphilus indolicus]
MVYNNYSDFLYNKFGEKVYKLPIKLDLTCPNRDGKLGAGGCTFCGEEGGSFENSCGSIENQLISNMNIVKKKYKANKYISYFQNFTNTYLDYEQFVQNINDSLIDGVVGVSISTRPDCLSDEILDFLEEVNKKYFVTVELGLQTANYRTLKKINRGHGVAEFVDATIRLHKRNLRVCAHVILNLPYDDELDNIETAHLLNALNVEEVKIHALYILKGTLMGQLYQEGKIDIISLEEYKRRTILFLRHLDSSIVVQRIIGRAPEKNSLFCNWNTSWWKIRDEIVAEMKEKGFHQGQCKGKDW